jgi:Fe-S cluster assembly protein SufD
MSWQKTIPSNLFDALTKQYHEKKEKLFFAPLAFQKFLELGVPTKRNELYRTMGIKKLNELSLKDSKKSKQLFNKSPNQIVLKQGIVDSINVDTPLLVQTIQEASHTFGPFLHSYYSKCFDEEKDPFYAISSALCDGILVFVPKEYNAIETLHIINFFEGTKQEAIFPKIIFILERGAKLNVILTHDGAGGFCLPTIDFILQENSKAHLQQIDLNTDCNLFSFVRADQKRDSLFKSLALSKGGEYKHFDVRVNLEQENAECFLNGLWLLNEKNRCFTNVFVQHESPYCRSFQHFKGILSDRSKSLFEGEIYVKPAAQKTDAFQLNQNLILSDDATAHSRPKLEIFADDVKASHGSTTAQIDGNLLFYLQTRGISKQRARQLLIEAFLMEMVNKLKNPKIQTQILEDARQFSTT